MSQRYQNTVLIRNVHQNKQKTPNKHQTKQDNSGKIVIHEIKSLIYIYSLHKPIVLTLLHFRERLFYIKSEK